MSKSSKTTITKAHHEFEALQILPLQLHIGWLEHITEIKKGKSYPDLNACITLAYIKYRHNTYIDQTGGKMGGRHKFFDSLNLRISNKEIANLLGGVSLHIARQAIQRLVDMELITKNLVSDVINGVVYKNMQEIIPNVENIKKITLFKSISYNDFNEGVVHHGRVGVVHHGRVGVVHHGRGQNNKNKGNLNLPSNSLHSFEEEKKAYRISASHKSDSAVISFLSYRKISERLLVDNSIFLDLYCDLNNFGTLNKKTENLFLVMISFLEYDKSCKELLKKSMKEFSVQVPYDSFINSWAMSYMSSVKTEKKCSIEHLFLQLQNYCKNNKLAKVTPKKTVKEVVAENSFFSKLTKVSK